MLKKWMSAVCVAALITQFGCGSDTINKIESIADEAKQTIDDVTNVVGDSVAALDQVNGTLVDAAGATIAQLEQLNYNVSFNENGIEFTGSENITGILGINGNTIFLQINSTSKDAETIQTIARITNVFSDQNTIEDKLNAAINENSSQYIELSNGYIRIDGSKMTVYITTGLQ